LKMQPVNSGATSFIDNIAHRAGDQRRWRRHDGRMTG
jgi:hypothetical protein